MSTFALIHSPLVGASCWMYVADCLRAMKTAVIVPTLQQSDSATPFWQQHAISAAQQIDQAASKEVILVGHSGAGPLLPAIGERLRVAPQGYIFVDAGLPMNGKSRLEMMRLESVEWAEGLESHLLANGRFPQWRDDDLKSLIPNPERRERLLADLQPRAYPFFNEPINFSDGWKEKPCGYIWWSEPYEFHAAEAERRGWPVLRQDAGHFHMLVDETAVAQAIFQLVP